MKKIETLKADLLKDKVEFFYVFYGEDFGIRRHYIDKLSTYFDKRYLAESYLEIQPTVMTKSLFSQKQLFVVSNDDEFASRSKTDINNFVSRLHNKDYCCVFVYDNPKFESTNLFKYFEDYCTEFQAVETKIAREFVKGELDSIPVTDVEDLAFNCDNLYSNILLEADKIKEYQEGAGVSQRGAYESLKVKEQLLKKAVEFDSREFMNCVIEGNFIRIADFCKLVDDEDGQGSFFKYLTAMFNDFIIAGLCRKYGKFDGGSRAYNSYKLPWYRIKEIRELNLVYPDTYYFECAYKLAGMDFLIKKGRLDRNNLMNYFLSSVI